MITLKTKEQIEQMAQAGKILAACHREIAKRIRPGVTTREIDQFVEQFLEKHGATPEQKGYQGYRYATCASVNDVVCHGFPSKQPLAAGDIVTIDMVVNKEGWLADSAWSYAVGKISRQARKLLQTTKESLYVGIEQAVAGNRLGDISHAIQVYAESRGYGVVREFTGHGIGQVMHEDPYVPHYGSPGKGIRLKAGMVITIEPMLTTGSYDVRVDDDGWTARTMDGSLAAQYEHTVAITDEGPVILTEQ
ncbi:type I methionyl aminopeptidase [Brevibacillus humidisoli]|uniref:type I methionyl aminopeptidase n=1 Tax=Brevibacillus humidisoli TaxID=2895522 RepID=UPI001E4BA039|nr:type I methionyl aminopeptidase [Brevibacillus humidisoli]UFJ39822.1 type I methionyl aminopeptidase [Brevibacillus humidisoli]